MDSLLVSVSAATPLVLAEEAWFAVRTRPRFEAAALNDFQRKGIEAFLPKRTTLRYWSDRKKQIEEPIFPGYMFVRIDRTQTLSVLRSVGVISFVGPRSGPPPAVGDEEIDSLRHLVEHKLRIDPYPFLKEGMRVRVVRGVLAGTEGFLIQKQKQCKLVICVEILMRSVSVEIEASAVEAL